MMRKVLIVILIVLASFFTWLLINHKKHNLNLPVLSFQVTDKDSIKVYALNKSWFDKYLNNLTSCYNESYWYDKTNNYTIMKFKIEDKKLYQKHNLDIIQGNYCEDEYSLKADYIKTFLDNAVIKEATLIKSLSNKEIKYSPKNIDKYLVPLLSSLEKAEGVKVTKRINNDEQQFKLSLYYEMNKESYIMEIYEANDYLILRVVDQNDHNKYIKYKIDKEIQKNLKKIID